MDYNDWALQRFFEEEEFLEKMYEAGFTDRFEFLESLYDVPNY